MYINEKETKKLTNPPYPLRHEHLRFNIKLNKYTLGDYWFKQCLLIVQLLYYK